MSSAVRIGVDTGGTFTDLVLDPGGGAPLLVHKLPSTPAQPELAVICGVAGIMAQLAAVTGRATGARPLIIHGSTVATNALLEGKGARAAFVTTAGFEDTLFIGRQIRRELYALEPSKVAPPLRHGDCLGVEERIAFDGAVLRELSEHEISRIVERLCKLQVDAVAISLLHSYANPGHERRIAQAVRAQLPGLHVTVSHELLPEFREYERGVTCLINAVVAPCMAAYIGELSNSLGEGNLRIMASAGGTLPPREMLRVPAQSILSGPAGGLLGALAQACAAGITRCITLDMGGTSTDVALSEGAPQLGVESEINGIPLRLPALAIHTVGAGGGSLAWVDAGGALRAGPQSAGADPGPACYGRQHVDLQATVTDAHVVLGHLTADQPLAGNLWLQADLARQALSRLAQQAGLSVERTAEGVVRVADSVMARAVRRVSLEQGHDPREFALVAYGGAGGLHAAQLAQQLGLRRVLVPTMPGLLSALGMLCSAPLYTFSYAVMLNVPAESQPGLAQLPEVLQAVARLEQQAMAALAGDGVPPPERRLEFSLDLRYSGQSHELTIPLAGGGVTASFAEKHRELYGYDAPGRALEIVAARVKASGTPREVTLPVIEPRTSKDTLKDAVKKSRIYEADGWIDAWRIDRRELCAGDGLDGPGMVDEYSATTLVPAGWRCTVNLYGQLLLEQVGEAGV